MKHYLILLFFISSIAVSAQETDSTSAKPAFGDDTSPFISTDEALFFKYYLETRSNYDLNGKKIVFISGKTGNNIQTKKAFFDEVKIGTSRRTKVSTFIIEFTKSEKIESGGYDALLGYNVTDTKKINKKKIIKNLKDSIK